MKHEKVSGTRYKIDIEMQRKDRGKIIRTQQNSIRQLKLHGANNSKLSMKIVQQKMLKVRIIPDEKARGKVKV